MKQYPGAHGVGVVSLEAAGVLATLFYPADSAAAGGGGGAKWLRGPPGFYAGGYARYVHVPAWLAATLVRWLLDAVRLPAAQAPQLAPRAALPSLPVAVFTHGLAGNQTTYSTLCGSLASRGFLVLSIEHRDGTASVTAKNNYADVLEYIRYKGAPEKGIEFRKEQLKQRVQEIQDAHALLVKLNNGESVKNLLSSDGENVLPDFTNRIDLENSIIIGHSFGAGTAIEVLQQSTHKFTAAVTLDPWVEPNTSTCSVPIPMLSIQAEKFHWRENFDILQRFWNHSLSHNQKFFSVVLDTGHQDISDVRAFGYRFTRWFTPKAKQGVPPALLFDSYDQMVGAFLKEVLKGRNPVLDSTEFASVDGKLVLHGEEAFKHLDVIMKK
ncbi:platelet-activating factor acetylhydrolase [Obelidium mucronatum]|nr:platelet-activating factor acetylhydrolase [Obelidium mucronatum]